MFNCIFIDAGSNYSKPENIRNVYFTAVILAHKYYGIALFTNPARVAHNLAPVN